LRAHAGTLSSNGEDGNSPNGAGGAGQAPFESACLEEHQRFACFAKYASRREDAAPAEGGMGQEMPRQQKVAIGKAPEKAFSLFKMHLENNHIASIMKLPVDKIRLQAVRLQGYGLRSPISTGKKAFRSLILSREKWPPVAACPHLEVMMESG